MQLESPVSSPETTFEHIDFEPSILATYSEIDIVVDSESLQTMNVQGASRKIGISNQLSSPVPSLIREQKCAIELEKWRVANDYGAPNPEIPEQVLLFDTMEPVINFVPNSSRSPKACRGLRIRWQNQPSQHPTTFEAIHPMERRIDTSNVLNPPSQLSLDKNNLQPIPADLRLPGVREVEAGRINQFHSPLLPPNRYQQSVTSWSPFLPPRKTHFSSYHLSPSPSPPSQYQSNFSSRLPSLQSPFPNYRQSLSRRASHPRSPRSESGSSSSSKIEKDDRRRSSGDRVRAKSKSGRSKMSNRPYTREQVHW